MKKFILVLRILVPVSFLIGMLGYFVMLVNSDYDAPLMVGTVFCSIGFVCTAVIGVYHLKVIGDKINNQTNDPDK